jgi:hypothetical protein
MKELVREEDEGVGEGEIGRSWWGRKMKELVIRER